MSKKQRDKWEMWFDAHNHKMEFFRTMFGFFGMLFAAISAVAGIAVFLKVFGML